MRNNQMRALVIYNPTSGKKRYHKKFPIIKKKLKELGYTLTTLYLTNFTGHEPLINKACSENWDAIFIAGGDGTINYTIQIIAEEKNCPPIGIFPFGTSNEFATYIGMTTDIDHTISMIAKRYFRWIDIGKFGNKYFANIASAGWLSDITYRTSPFLKSYIGEWAYILSFLKYFFTTKPTGQICVEFDDTNKINDLSLFLVMNGNGVGPFERLILNSDCKEGYFHLFICHQSNRFALFCELLRIMLHCPKKRDPFIRHTNIQTATFTIPDKVSLNLDGDKATTNQFKFQALPKHIKVFSAT
ncbi:YegS/Rv2252/BmrU family lipid kinase [Bacillus shivajii]|uniref:diacylglycerol/lipid kinase family protein n=1 Tax=Bacillus shivajii TaxID=1983719 RepID=UPI001CFA61DF|nr:YegS/Rv2252/BmrU family lipid kinase [Bacillus shivajii]UCZ51978.1 YegS/Rv2252/BmrU family lipid kinase [Bacillus shivajii]